MGRLIKDLRLCPSTQGSQRSERSGAGEGATILCWLPWVVGSWSGSMLRMFGVLAADEVTDVRTSDAEGRSSCTTTAAFALLNKMPCIQRDEFVVLFESFRQRCESGCRCYMLLCFLSGYVLRGLNMACCVVLVVLGLIALCLLLYVAFVVLIVSVVIGRLF